MTLNGRPSARTVAKELESCKQFPPMEERRARTSILEFVQATTDSASPKFVPPEARIATFDQDGTLWVEHPMYSQVVYCLDRVPALVKAKPELADVEPVKTVLSGDREALVGKSGPHGCRQPVLEARERYHAEAASAAG